MDTKWQNIFIHVDTTSYYTVHEHVLLSKDNDVM